MFNVIEMFIVLYASSSVLLGIMSWASVKSDDYGIINIFIVALFWPFMCVIALCKYVFKKLYNKGFEKFKSGGTDLTIKTIYEQRVYDSIFTILFLISGLIFYSVGATFYYHLSLFTSLLCFIKSIYWSQKRNTLLMEQRLLRQIKRRQE